MKSPWTYKFFYYILHINHITASFYHSGRGPDFCVWSEFRRVHVNFGQKPFAFDLEARYAPPFSSVGFKCGFVFASLRYLPEFWISAYHIRWLPRLKNVICTHMHAHTDFWLECTCCTLINTQVLLIYTLLGYINGTTLTSLTRVPLQFFLF